MTKVKFCGITTMEEIAFCNELMPDYVGFVFAISKRQVSLNEVRVLRKALNQKISTVGVFVDQPIEEIVALVKELMIQYVQLHGSEDAAYVQQLQNHISIPLIRAVKVGDTLELENTNLYDYYLFDTYYKDQEGGGGQTFNWEILQNNQKQINKPFFLAGGLNATNITSAIEQTAPFAVDISSGIETNGKKDFYKMKDIIEKVRR